MSRGKLSFAQQACVKKAGLLMQRLGALWPGCRVGAAVSGGADSMVLLKTLKIRQGITPFKFEIMALHVNPGFDREDHARLAEWLGQEGISGHIEIGSFGPEAHSEANASGSACFFCARQRRKRLFELCKSYNLTHLAFGHNAGDLLTSFMMNFFRNGRMQGMSASESFFNGGLQVIRPLLLVEKKYILKAARQWGLPIWPNACPTSGSSGRDQAAELAELINRELPGARRSMLGALFRAALGEGPHPAGAAPGSLSKKQ